ncbi:MAG: hypothetical protein FJ265_00645 [Planctomycetes bacterium]|nr:hypothetical protein [Planctomycetota bacterium]
MKGWTRIACGLGLLAAACGGPTPPWPVPPPAALDLRVQLAPQRVALLQPVTVHLDLYRRADLPVEFAPQVDAADFLATATVAPEVPFGGGLWQRTTLVLRPHRGPGELVVPPFVAAARDGTISASTPEQKVAVVSSLDGQPPELEAPSGPLAGPSTVWWWALGGYLAAALGALAWYLWPGRRPRAQPAAVALPPHVKAQRALLRLRNEPRTTPAQVDAFYVGVSAVLRTYLEERFGLRAPERTTEEFLRELEGGDALARGHRAELERFLRRCDLVKFAARVPGETEHLETWALADGFVAATRADRAAGPQAEVGR